MAVFPLTHRGGNRRRKLAPRICRRLQWSTPPLEANGSRTLAADRGPVSRGAVAAGRCARPIPRQASAAGTSRFGARSNRSSPNPITHGRGRAGPAWSATRRSSASASVTTTCSACSAPAGWAGCTGRATPGSGATSRSSCCRPSGPAIPIAWRASIEKRACWPRSTIRTSPRFTASRTPTGIRALVLEYIEGDTLADRIARGPLPLAEALTIARQVKDALDAAHETRHRPSRSEAGEHQDHAGRAGQGARLRDCDAGGRARGQRAAGLAGANRHRSRDPRR